MFPSATACCTAASRQPSSHALELFRHLLLLLALAALTATGAFAQPVSATGGAPGTALEDHVEVSWSTNAPIPATSRFIVERDEALIATLAPSENIFRDYTAVPDLTYDYCISERSASGSENLIACAPGQRSIAPPTGVSASDGLFEGHVAVDWSDRSQIEGGYNVYRDAGNAIDFDGTNDFATAGDVLDLVGSYTFEFWARRASTGTDDFVVNLETNPNGDPVDVDVEIGFTSANRFQLAFGSNTLQTAVYTDTEWHHWAVVYDAPNLRRFIMRDGELVANDVVALPSAPTGDLEFGRRSKQGTVSSRGHFHGQLDEVRFWTRALTLDEVREVMGGLLIGSPTGLASYWPMDAENTLVAPDIVGTRPWSLTDMATNDWIPSGVPHLHGQIGAGLTSFADLNAVPGFQEYAYEVAAFQDMNQDGTYTEGTDYESARRTDTGWRGIVTPPSDVAATDGQFLDRVRITWIDGSTTETGYRVYRGNTLIATIAANETQYDDKSPSGEQEYCVASLSGATESVRMCDFGRAGALAPPLSVSATSDVSDEQVLVSWEDAGDTEDGFELFRDGALLATLAADAEQHADLSALQGVPYEYCVRAFSKADPLFPSYSETICAPAPGQRAIILAPEDLEATDSEFEERVDLKWTNPSTTAMVFMVYRDNVLVEVLDFRRVMMTDVGIASDTEYEYCVTAGTVVEHDDPTSLQGRVLQVLESIDREDAVRLRNGGALTPAEAKRQAVYEALGLSLTQTAMDHVPSGFFESAAVCDPGSRSLAPPSEVEASDGTIERYVEVTWTQNSQVGARFLLHRVLGNDEVFLDTLSANQTRHLDTTGTPGVTYQYVVKAFDDAGVSVADSDEGNRKLNPPTQAVASQKTSETRITLSWKDNSSAEDGYRLYRMMEGQLTQEVVGETPPNDPTFVDSVFNDSPGKTAHYEIAAFDQYGESPRISVTGQTALFAPTNVNASDVYGETIAVVWVDRSEVETGYRLTRRKRNSSVIDKTENLPAGTTFYEDPDDPDGEYEYCVVSVRAAGASEVLSDAVCDYGSMGAVAGGGNGGGGNGGGSLLEGPQKYHDATTTTTVDADLRFGDGIAMGDDSTSAIGAPGAGDRGQAAFFAPGSVGLFQSQGTFIPDNGIDFGQAVDIDGEIAVVGDPGQLGQDDGRFSVLQRTGNSWSQILSRSAGFDAGISVAIADSFVIVGDPTGGDFGRAYLCNFQAQPTCGTMLDLGTNVTPDDDAEFGAAVDISRFQDGAEDELRAIVGAPGADSVFVFECDLVVSDCDAAGDWTVARTASSPFAGNHHRFGAAVSIDKDLAVVGAPAADGIVVYERSATQWDEQDKRRRGDDFGFSVSVKDAKVLVGAPDEESADYTGAGAVYVYDWTGDDLSEEPVRYDARVVGVPSEGAQFGYSVYIGPELYLVGAPYDLGRGSVYAIPFGLEPPSTPVPAPEVVLTIPGNVRASDGTAPDRIQLRWEDEADNEDGFLIYRSVAGGAMEQLAEVVANIEFYDDFDAEPGEAYTYCVSAFSTSSTGTSESDQACDIGWRPPNGSISGRVAVGDGAGTDGALVCLDPGMNRGLLFDGIAGFIDVDVARDEDGASLLDLADNFTIEAWVRPHDISAERTIVSRDSAYTLAIADGDLVFSVVTSGGVERATADTDILAGTWRHVAVVRDGDNDVTFYLDGQNVAAATSDNQVVTAGPDSLTIGIGNESAFFHGELDEIRIWGVARGAAQIAEERFAPLTGEEEGLVGYWPLDEGLRRIVPDLSESANHGTLEAGVYLTDVGAQLDVCAQTGGDGNYTIARIRYGQSTEFRVIPSREGRDFAPSFKQLTLSLESPVQNEVFFNDVTAYDVSGRVVYQVASGDRTLTCPVPDVVIHVDKDNVAADDNVKTTTGEDGSFAVAVDPSVGEQDPWYVIPEFQHPEDAAQVHAFDPPYVELNVHDDVKGLVFADQQRFTLSGHFSGGEPETCGRDIGTALIRVYTPDACFDSTLTVDSAEDAGFFSIELPPLQYLVEVVDVLEPPSGERGEDVKAFFQQLGAVEVDLRRGDVARNLTYRAPLMLAVEGLDAAPSCQAISVSEGGELLRTLPNVPIIGEFEGKLLTISVEEDYGDSGTCAVGEGTVTIYDAIADRVDNDSTMAIEDGVVEYTTFGTSPNPFSGARIDGVDRSYQKPITFVAQVEGRPALTHTEWAIVEGFRQRAATFVSATTDPFPAMILRDPPGSNSFAFVEKGSSNCLRLSELSMLGGGAGPDLDFMIGFKPNVGFSLGLHNTVDTGGGLVARTRTIIGRDSTKSTGPGSNYEVCFTTTDTWSTSNDPTWVGEDIYTGVALNLIFALADNLKSTDACEVEVSEVLATDLDEQNPFETTYSYGKSHIQLSLIPELQRLIELGGDHELEGEVDGEAVSIRLQRTLENWQRHLEIADSLSDVGLANATNRSFSGGTEYSHVESLDSTRTVDSYSTRFYVNSENTIGGIFSFGYDNVFAASFEINHEFINERDSTVQQSFTTGYTLSDGDTGDFFSVDVGTDPRYGTPVFKTASGRSSNPCETDTQCRDNPIIAIDPPVVHNVAPDDLAEVTLLLTNGSESDERRQYTLATPGNGNPDNAVLSVTGDILGGARLETFLIDPGTTINVNLSIARGPSAFAYRDLAVMLYPAAEQAIWLADTRQPFARSDTAYFSVFFDSSGGNVTASVLEEGWNWFSINREGGEVGKVLEDVPAKHGDLVKSQRAESRFDSTSGWVGDLRELVPGYGYRLRLSGSTVFRMLGEPVEERAPIELTRGWNWIGYLPAKRMPVEDVMASLNDRVMEGDVIVGEEAFAQYVKGAGWVGTLRDMMPGEGYAIYLENGGSLVYPPTPETVKPRDAVVRETTARGPAWYVDPMQFDAAMTVVAEVKHDGVPMRQTTTNLAVLDGEEVRGLGEVHYVESLDKYLAFFLIYGGADEEKSLVVHAYDGEADALFEKVATIPFKPNGILGQPASPVEIELANAGLAPELQDLPDAFALHANYPNPFNETTTIAYDLPESSDVELVVYDILGRRIATLVEGPVTAGHHKILFDGRPLASGVYLYRMQVGQSKYVGKMVLVR